ncbi:hypothetical protein BC833DRAFT_599942 [Globomyces pollinis-pini]|nr:hypothetical protein BC833DRAFT_599942 [Globomyces pollinis-pini]
MNFDFPNPNKTTEAKSNVTGLASGLIPLSGKSTGKLDFDDFDDILGSDGDSKLEKKNSKSKSVEQPKKERRKSKDSSSIKSKSSILTDEIPEARSSLPRPAAAKPSFLTDPATASSKSNLTGEKKGKMTSVLDSLNDFDSEIKNDKKAGRRGNFETVSSDTKKELDTNIFSNQSTIPKPNTSLNFDFKSDTKPKTNKQEDSIFGEISLASSAGSRRGRGSPKKDEVEGTDDDLMNIMGLGKESPKRPSLTNLSFLDGNKPKPESKEPPKPAATANNEKSFIASRFAEKVGQPEPNDDLPSFLQDGLSTKRQGRGGRNMAIDTTPIDLFSGVSSKTTSILKSTLDSPVMDSKPSLSFLNNAQSENSSNQQNKGGFSILDVLDKAEKKSNEKSNPDPSKKEKINQLSVAVPAKMVESQSLSSIAMLSETDEDSDNDLVEVTPITPHMPEIPEVKSKSKPPSIKTSKSSQSLSSTKSATSKRVQLPAQNTPCNHESIISDLERRIQHLQDEREVYKSDIENLEREIKSNKVDHELELKKELEKLEWDLNHKHELETKSVSHENEKLKKELENVKSEMKSRLDLQKQSYLNEIAMLRQNSEKTSQLDDLIGQVETTTNIMNTLQLKMNNTCESYMSSRESSIHNKESQLSQLQEILSKDSQDLERERKKIQQLLVTLESTIKQNSEKQERERLDTSKQKSSLQIEMQEFEQTRDSILFSLHQDQAAFQRECEQWEDERKKIMTKLNSDRKELAMAKAQVTSQQRRIQQKEQEFIELKKHQEAQFIAEYRMYEEDRHNLNLQISDTLRQSALLNSEKIKLDARQREIEIVSSVYKKEQLELENTVDRVSKMRDEAVKEKELALQLHNETLAIRDHLESNREFYNKEIQCFNMAKKSYIQDRVNRGSQRARSQRKQPHVSFVYFHSIRITLVTIMTLKIIRKICFHH